MRGLRGIIAFGPFGPGFLGRPLLGFTREELRAQALEWNLRWIEDPANREPRHDRNFLRLDVLPQLTARWPAAVVHAGRLAEQMADAEGILDAVAEQDAAGLDDPLRLPQATLAVLDPARQRNLLRHLLRRAGLGVPGSVKIEELRHALLEARADLAAARALAGRRGTRIPAPAALARAAARRFGARLRGASACSRSVVRPRGCARVRACRRRARAAGVVARRRAHVEISRRRRGISAARPATSASR